MKATQSAACWRGHAWTDESTEFVKKPDGHRTRLCRICRLHREAQSPKPLGPGLPCSVADCAAPAVYGPLQLCGMHDARMKRHGNLAGLIPQARAEERFWRFVKPNDGCWLWTGHRNNNGYGVFQTDEHYYAHRWSYAHHKGSIPKGLEVMHACDVPACVNPSHLSLGTHAENMADMKAKGRHRKPGSRNGG